MGSITLDDVAKMIDNLGKELKTDNENLRKEIDGKLLSAVAEVKTDISNLSSKHDNLEAKVERLDRLSHSSDLLINGVPFLENEDLMDIYNRICTTIAFIAKDYTLLSIFRLKKQNSRSPTIILKFISSQAKSDFYFRYLKFRKLSLIHLGFESDVRVYVTESLTETNSECYKFAMNQRRNGLLHKVYTYNCLVFIKQTKEAVPIRIDNMQQLLTITSASNPNANHKRKPTSEPDPESPCKANETKTCKLTDSTKATGSGSMLNPFKLRTTALMATNNKTTATSPSGTIDSFFNKKTATLHDGKRNDTISTTSHN